MPKYKVTLAQLTKGEDPRVFLRHINLPFVPFDSFTVHQLTYKLKEGSFLAITNYAMHDEAAAAQGAQEEVTLEDLEQLGREFRRLGWKRHLEPLRELYAATRDGGKAEWSIEHAARLASYVGLGANPLPIHEGGCASCVVPKEEPWKGTRTVCHLPDRWVSACTRCGAEWVTMDVSAPR